MSFSHKTFCGKTLKFCDLLSFATNKFLSQFRRLIAVAFDIQPQNRDFVAHGYQPRYIFVVKNHLESYILHYLSQNLSLFSWVNVGLWLKVKHLATKLVVTAFDRDIILSLIAPCGNTNYYGQIKCLWLNVRPLATKCLW